MKLIKQKAIELKDKYELAYKKWVYQNPGYVMNGNSIKMDTLQKASFAESIEELEAMLTFYKISLRSINGMNGFRFSIAAIEELIKELCKQ